MTVMLTFGHYAGFEFLCGRPHGMWFRLCLGWVALTVLGYDVEETLARSERTLDSLEGICEERWVRLRTAREEFTRIAESLEGAIEGLWTAWAQDSDLSDAEHDERCGRIALHVQTILSTSRAYRARIPNTEARDVVAEINVHTPVSE
jgi:hypothetical protein